MRAILLLSYSIIIPRPGSKRKPEALATIELAEQCLHFGNRIMLIPETSFVYSILASRKELHTGFLPKNDKKQSGQALCFFHVILFYGYQLTSANNHRVHRRGRSRTARQYKVGFSDSPGRIRRMRPLPPGDS